MFCGGTRRKHSPLGDGTCEKEKLGNRQAQRVACLCMHLHLHGAYFSVENPKGSLLWYHPDMLDLLKVGFYVDFDQCMYNLRIPHVVDQHQALLVKKPTRLLTNLSCLTDLRLQCDRSHKHLSCKGSVRVIRDGKERSISISAAAGAYPLELCRAWSRSVARFCKACR